MANRAAKGPTWERTFCKLLSLWWSGGTNDSLFWRTSNSGGRATVRGRKGQATRGHHGDVCATCPEAEPFCRVFAPELKRGYNKATIQDLLDKPAKAATQTYEAWITKAEQCRIESGALCWMLVVKRDHREPLVLLPHATYRELFPNLDFGSGNRATIWMSSKNSGDLYIVAIPLTNFLSSVSPERIRTLLERSYGNAS